MWISRIANPLGGSLPRKMLMFVAAVFVTAFSFILLASPVAHAADAEWKGNALVYNGDQYVRADSSNPPGIPENAPIYAYSDSSAGKAHFVYFEPNADPLTSPGATYVVYDFTPPDTFSNPTDKQSITVDTQSAGAESTTSCDSTFTGGIGWIICPVTNFLAKAMDWLYNILSEFLSVRPIQTTQENALYRAWSFMRNLANVAFVIAFLIIIYSQITSIGLSSYGIKKLLPRLIIAAVLVNVSYWICAIAIDVFNVLGYSIQDLFIMIRNNLVGGEGNSWDVVSWESITGFILSGGTAAAATGIGVYALIGGTVAGAIYMLAPILVGVLLAVLVALLVLAARQAIITVLVILAPLAFVAYLLPNTEKYFERWRGLGLTMLIMFPMFSIIFGGSQLAGAVIIQNADSINTLILGMAVQVAPVVITPLLIRFSGSLLGKIAGIVNNPNRGLIDRTRKWAGERAEQNKNRVLAGNRRDFLARGAKGIDRRRRTREGWNKANQSLVDAQWENTGGAHEIYAASAKAELIKQAGQSAAENKVEASKLVSGEMQNLDLKVRAGKLDVDLSKAKVDANWEAARAGYNPATGKLVSDIAQGQRTALDDSVRSTQITSRDLALTALRKQMVEQKQQSQVTESLLNNTDDIRTSDGAILKPQDYAGGVLGKTGAGSAFATAVARERKEYNERVNEKTHLMRHFRIDSDQRQRLALGENIPAEKDGFKYVFDANDVHAREAAIEYQLKAGSFGQIETIIKESGVQKDATGNVIVKGKTSDYATTISQAITENNLPKKAIFFGSQTIDDIEQGRLLGDDGLNSAAVRVLLTGKVTDEALSAMSASAIKRMFNVADKDFAMQTPAWAAAKPEERTAFETNMKSLHHSAWRIMNDDLLRRNADQAARAILADRAQEPPHS